MNGQQAIVAALVLACGVYTVWVLMPTSARNWVRRVLLRRPPRLAEGCGACSGCAAPATLPPGEQSEQRVRVVRR